MQVIKDLFKSKKFVTSLLGVIGAIAVRLGIPEVDVVEITALLSPLLVYVAAQGVADHGKERVKVIAEFDEDTAVETVSNEENRL